MLRSFNQPYVVKAKTTRRPASKRTLQYASDIKPVLDRVGALLGLLILAPVLLLIAAVILCASGRPILFCQQRMGRHYQPFTIIKFRTMSADRVTGAGRVLRQTGLDELPQLWNILRGDMSWIGPRPLTEADIHRLGWDTPYYRGRWRVKPGITGLAQLYGGIGRKVTLLCDQTYIRRLAAVADFRILAASVLICLLGKRRVRKHLYQQRPRQARRNA